MSIWIILKNLVWTCKECNFYQYWATITCIYFLFVFFFTYGAHIWMSICDFLCYFYFHFLHSMFTLGGVLMSFYVLFMFFFFLGVRLWRCINNFLDLLFVFLSQCLCLEVCLCSKMQQRWGDLLPTTLCLLFFPSPLLKSHWFLLFSTSIIICHLMLCYSLHFIELEVRTIVGILSSLKLLFYSSSIKLQGWGYIFKQLQLIVFCSIRVTIYKL
jgi:hypothetical protein